MQKKLNVVAGTGLSGNGKSTILDLVAVILDANRPDGRIMRAEMSSVIKYGLGLHSKLGESVRKHQKLMENGGFLPDDVAIPLLGTWLNHATSVNQNLQTLLFGGLPRTTRQKGVMRNYFEAAVIVDQKIKPEVALKSVLERAQKSTVQRTDDLGGEAVFALRKSEFLEHTLPMLHSCNGERVLLHRDEHPCHRLEKVFSHIRGMKYPVLAHSLTKRALNRLRSGDTHPIHREILNVLTGKGITPGAVAYQA
ncbi:MAG: hypothetical protein V4524_03645 [Patescibacteria group bacterium]